MVWAIEFRADAAKRFKALDRPVQLAVLRYLRDRIQTTDNPRVLGRALAGDLSGRWRYRVGDYRIICEIHDARLVVLVVDVGHRSKIYD